MNQEAEMLQEVYPYYWVRDLCQKKVPGVSYTGEPDGDSLVPPAWNVDPRGAGDEGAGAGRRGAMREEAVGRSCIQQKTPAG